MRKPKSRGHGSVFTDATAQLAGILKRRSRGVTELYWCAACGKSQVESVLVRSRRTRARCRHCGRLVQLMRERKQPEPPKVKTCRKCGVRVRQTSRLRYCRTCFAALPLRKREVLLGVRDKHGRITLWNR